MFDNDTGRPLAELLHALQSRISIGDVVVGKLLALELAGTDKRNLALGSLGIEGGRLVGILAVTQILNLFNLDGKGGRKGFDCVTQAGTQIVGDGAVISGGMLKNLDRQSKVGCG